MKTIMVFCCIGLMALSSHVSALTLVSEDKEISLTTAQLVEQANYTHEMYGPFRRQTTLFEGFILTDFLKQQLGVNATSVRFIAFDGYDLTLNNVDQRKLMLVVKENGEVLTVRNHGPLRLIETDLGGHDPKNISLFDDWVWMIKRIEVVDE
ncbi:hypothetical protein [Marinomonas fungiae]|uniref:Oxidoreductase molybdopterin binding domain n=1 Tax=Marinomonas fungiae TaxID=1137284 RepID=A0A0K6IMJ6_9GAMM|nr:hypothetical protein [Marinomonas fungiae]CUB04314.1 Uncharacterized protein Ga0061065_106133 [Marinomonas fungiae]